MTVVSFCGQSNRNSASIAANPSRLVNLYPEPVGQGGRTSYLLQPCYGMTEFAALDGVFIRAMSEIEGDIYAVLPGSIYRVSTLGAVRLGDAQLGETATISRNLNAVTATTGGTYYLWDATTNTLSSPSTGAIAGPVAWVEYLAGRTLLGELGTGKFGWSDIADPSTFDGLNFATAEAREDATTRGLVVGNALYLMGERTTEVWIPSGSGSSAFVPSGAVIDRGIKSFGLAVNADGVIFAVGDDDIVYLMSGNQARPVSNPAVTAAIRDGEAQACNYWEERGHKFASVTFRDRPSWVFDIATQEWWERGEGPDKRAWRGRAAARLGADWMIGGEDGVVYRLEPSSLDAGSPHYREATSYVLGDGGKWFTIAELEISTGAGFETGTIQLELGNGVTFGRPMMRGLPPVGAFDAKTVYRALGRYNRVVARLSMTGAALPFYGDCRVRLA